MLRLYNVPTDFIRGNKKIYYYFIIVWKQFRFVYSDNLDSM